MVAHLNYTDTIFLTSDYFGVVSSTVIGWNYGLFVPKTFRSLERKVLGTKSPDTIQSVT